MPLVLEPYGGEDDSPAALTAWAAEHRRDLDEWLHRHGALLFRGFRLGTPEEFRAAAVAVCPNLRGYAGGDSPRKAVADRVYTSTEFPPELEIGLHNELSYAGRWPERLFFCCLVAARSGGETHIADGREVYDRLDAAVRERFVQNGVAYLQHLRDAGGPSGPGKSWQETFETTESDAVERICAEQEIEFRWTERGLRTTSRRPAVIEHPARGEICWFNQADLWHASFDAVKEQETGAPSEPASGERLGSHACYGDGSEIPTEDLEAVRAAYHASEVVSAWRAGDLMIIDNVLVMHGRKPFLGKRRVLVAMA